MIRCFLLLLLGPPVAMAQAPRPAGSPQEIAKPLRKFDLDKDGKLTGDELKLARQAHNRGGREAEPRPARWKEILERQEKEFTQRRKKDFDLDASGKLEDSEKAALRGVWSKIAEQYSAARVTITAKYDRNDDGELNDQERSASRAENDRLRREIEDQCVREWRANSAPPAGAPVPPAAAQP